VDPWAFKMVINYLKNGKKMPKLSGEKKQKFEEELDYWCIESEKYLNLY
jgi:hypothetical protein